MKSFAVCLLSLLVSVSTASAEALTVLGQVRLADGSAVAGAQVLLFDVSDLRRGALGQATTDADGQFALPLAGFDRTSASSVESLSPPLGGRGLPQGFALGQNYPNPFNPSTVIPYQLAASGYVRLEVFNLLGQRVSTLVDGEQAAGAHTAVWTATDGSGRAVSAGVYLYRLTVASAGSADGAMATGRMVLVDGGAGIGVGNNDRYSLPLVPRGGGRVGGVSLGVENTAYGLVVSGAGLVPYMDVEFRVGSGLVVIEVAAQGRAKVVQDERGILGDVDNNGQVNLLDALLVAMYSANTSIAIPNGGDIALGDVNGDGVIDTTDAWLIGSYALNPSSAGLPAGIGEPIASPGGSGGGTLGEVRTFSLPGGGEMEFVWIEAGTFQMGSPESDSSGEDWERPVHEVEISEGFWLGKYEVTQGQWAVVMGTTPWSGEWGVVENPSHPAVYISWHDVQAFIGRLNAAAGDSLYRLPSEAEWEYACRAGTTTRWSFGDDASDGSGVRDYAWSKGNAWSSGKYYAHAVGLKRPNGWGLYDMHGNVYEWVQDWWDLDYYKRSPRVDPPGPTSGSDRVRRGGSVGDGVRRMRSADRLGDPPDFRSPVIGVRLLRIR